MQGQPASSEGKKRDKDINRILDARNDGNIDFELLVRVLERLGYTVRTRGGHLAFRRLGVPVRLTLARTESAPPPYQVRRVRRVILEFEVLEPDE
jgi:hypothetical protein